jgi:PAS domain S-box-containing protein
VSSAHPDPPRFASRLRPSAPNPQPLARRIRHTTTASLSHPSAQKATAEARRLGALLACGILDTPPEPAFDALAELAASICGTPSGFVAFVDRDRVWFKARYGLELSEVGRDESLCAHVIARSRLLVVPDAASDERYSGLPLVAGPLGARFYAGAPVRAPGGERVGVVGVLDTQPRKVAPEGRRALTLLAREAERLLELRRLEGQAAFDANRLRHIFENSGEAILLTTIDGDVVAANPAACALFRCSEDELRELGRAGVADPTDERLAAGLEERRKSGRFRGELRLRRADGSTFPAELTSVVFADADGALKTSMIIRDLTEWHRAEQELRESEQRLRLTIEEAHDAFVATDPTGRILEWNREAERELGWTREEIVGQDAFSTFVPPDRVEEFRGALNAVGAKRMSPLLSGRTEGEAQHKDGSRLPVEYTIWSLEVGGETLLNMFIHDISERKQSEEALRASREGLMDLFNGASDLIQLVEPDLRLQYVNPAWRSALGYQEEDVFGLPVLEIIAPEEREAYRAGLESVLAGTPRAVETTFVARDGRCIRVEGFESCRFVDHRPLSIRGFFRDVTQRHQIEEEREQLLEAERRAAELLAEQNERLRQLDEMRDEFVSLVSHQVRTPLTSIRGFLELLRDGAAGPLTDEQQRFLGFVADGSQRLLELADDLLFISRVDAGKLKLSLEDVDLGSLVAAAIEALQPVGDERGVALALEAEETPLVHVDQSAIRQAVDNLLSNGVKFTPKGGRVTLRVGTRDGAVLLEVADTGIGVPEAEQARLFERFFRASNALAHAIPGTGLGLAIVKEIANAHGGTVEFESTVGKGTTFRIVLPPARPAGRTRKLRAQRRG